MIMLYAYRLYLLHVTIVYVECDASNGEGDPYGRARQEASQNRTLSIVIVCMTTMSASGGGRPPEDTVVGIRATWNTTYVSKTFL